MASFIGKTISLLSQSDIRYRGILHSIDATQATIQLSNVYSMGTETRRPPAEFIPPQDTPYEFILFRAQEVKDLNVDSQPLPVPAQRNVRDDPAIIGVSVGPSLRVYYLYPPLINRLTDQTSNSASTSQPPRRRETNGRLPQASNPNAVRSAAASLENVERAMGDLRVADAPRTGRRGHASHLDEIQAGNIHVPAADFDFASSNAKFDKAALGKPDSDSDSEDSESGSEDVKTNPSDSEAERKKEKDKKEKPKGKETAYNPSKSFFDSLTPNSGTIRGGGQARGGRGRGRGYGRSRREEEAQRNLMTFGEATPPSLASGWGGRRGGPRRGGYASQGVVSNGRPG
ncbi:hypothetical protein K439DRAFT_1655375 [Ramaria rubella]|nr:hypothetical protein K439DRAFT_1655375 [Ramaria rubella]